MDSTVELKKEIARLQEFEAAYRNNLRGLIADAFSTLDEEEPTDLVEDNVNDDIEDENSPDISSRSI